MALATPSHWEPRPETAPRERELYVQEFSLATATLDELEAMVRALDAEAIDRHWSTDRSLEELAVLRTCHRIELVQIRRGPPEQPLPGPAAGWRIHRGEDALVHVYRVAGGLESLAAGEREVLDQVRASARRIRSRRPRPILGDLFPRMIAAIEGSAGPPDPPRSVAAIAATRLLSEVGRPFPRVLVVGSGVVGRQIAEALGPYARTTIVYRRTPPPEPLLRSSGARAVAIDELPEELPLCDGLIAAAKTGERLLGPADLEGRGRPITMIDLGIPRNIDPRTADLAGVRLIDLGTLYHGRSPSQGPSAEDPWLRACVAAAAERLDALLAEPGVDALMRDAEAVRRREVDRALPYFGPLSEEQRAALEHFSQRLVRRLLAAPLETIRSLPPGPARDRAMAAFAELVGSDARP